VFFKKILTLFGALPCHWGIPLAMMIYYPLPDLVFPEKRDTIFQKKDFPMKIEPIKYNKGLSCLFFSYDERRPPWRDAPAADRKRSPCPAVRRRDPEAGSIAEKTIFMVLVRTYWFMPVSPSHKNSPLLKIYCFYHRKASKLLKRELVILF
jgi:hypothetical protein